jgi:hypothetical protein
MGAVTIETSMKEVVAMTGNNAVGRKTNRYDTSFAR